MSLQVRPWLRERLLPPAWESAVASHPDAGPELVQMPPASAGLTKRPRDGPDAQVSMGGGLVQVFRFLTFAKDAPDKEEPFWLVAADPQVKVVVHLTARAVAEFHRHRRVLGSPVRTVSSLRGAILVLSSVTVELGRPPAHAERFLHGGNIFPFPAHITTEDSTRPPTNADRRTLVVHCDEFRYLGCAGEEAFWTESSWLWSAAQEMESTRLVRERLTARLVHQARILAAEQQGKTVTTMSFAPSTSTSSWGAELPAASQAPQPSERTRSGKRRRPHRGAHRKGRKSGSITTLSRSVTCPSAALASVSLTHEPPAPQLHPAGALIFNPLAFPMPVPAQLQSTHEASVIMGNSISGQSCGDRPRCEPGPNSLACTAPPLSNPSPSLQSRQRSDRILADESPSKLLALDSASSNVLASESSSSAEASQASHAGSQLAPVSLHSSLGSRVLISQSASEESSSLPPAGQRLVQSTHRSSSGITASAPASVQPQASTSVIAPTIFDLSRPCDTRALTQDQPSSREVPRTSRTSASQPFGSISMPPPGQKRSDDGHRSRETLNRTGDLTRSQDLLSTESKSLSISSIWAPASSGRNEDPSQPSQAWNSQVSSGGVLGPATPNRSTEGAESDSQEKPGHRVRPSGGVSPQLPARPSSSPPSPEPSASNASRASFDFGSPPPDDDVQPSPEPGGISPDQPQPAIALESGTDRAPRAPEDGHLELGARPDTLGPRPPKPPPPRRGHAAHEPAQQVSRPQLGKHARSPTSLVSDVPAKRRAVDTEREDSTTRAPKQQPSPQAPHRPVVSTHQPTAPSVPDWERIRAEAQARLQRLDRMRRRDRRDPSRQGNLRAIEQCHERLARQPR